MPRTRHQLTFSSPRAGKLKCVNLRGLPAHDCWQMRACQLQLSKTASPSLLADVGMSTTSGCCISHTACPICVQGAVAVEGEGHLWRPSRWGSTAAPPATPASSSVEPAQPTASSASEVSPSHSQDNRPAGTLLLLICKSPCTPLSLNVA